MEKLRILYLVNKNTYKTKMSRVRFHSMEAISKHPDVDLHMSGLYWEDWNGNKTAQQNIDRIFPEPDLVVAYKPFQLKKVENIRHPLCIRYNEMHDVSGTLREIQDSNASFIICHHLNDMELYRSFRLINKKIFFYNIPHSAEKTIYKDYGLEKDIDVLLAGAISHEYYPFRYRLREILNNKLASQCVTKILPHPGPNINAVRRGGAVLENYARMINRSKITLTCSGRFLSRFGKYTEIPMSGSMLAADLPDEDHDFFKKFMLVLDPKDRDEVIVDKIMYYLHHDAEREAKIKIGLELNKEFTQEKYAEKFVIASRHFLENYHK